MEEPTKDVMNRQEVLDVYDQSLAVWRDRAARDIDAAHTMEEKRRISREYERVIYEHTKLFAAYLAMARPEPIILPIHKMS